MPAPTAPFGYSDLGHTATGRRPDFERLVTRLQREGREEVILVTDLTRLFRNRANRLQVDRLLADGQAHVATIREKIETWTDEGRGRYVKMADLI
jgi:DNA invertase Pin-like site-specific DNA recombinase